MSFSLMTAINVDDIPGILQRCAACWRRGIYAKYPKVWELAADEVEKFAAELAVKIADAKKAELVPKRNRVVL